MPPRGPSSLIVDGAVSALAENSDLADHLYSPDFMWVTAHADLRGNHSHRPEWALLGAMLDDAATARAQLDLPEPLPGARGHITLYGTRHDLVCAYKDSGPTKLRIILALNTYRHVHPSWMIDQPIHTRHLLLTVDDFAVTPPDAAPPGPTPEPTLLRDLTTEELTETMAPLLRLPGDVTETLTAAIDAHPPDQKPALPDLFDMAQALAQTD